MQGESSAFRSVHSLSTVVCSGGRKGEESVVEQVRAAAVAAGSVHSLSKLSAVGTEKVRSQWWRR